MHVIHQNKGNRQLHLEVGKHKQTRKAEAPLYNFTSLTLFNKFN